MSRGRRFSDRPRRLPTVREQAAASHQQTVLLHHRDQVVEALSLALDALRHGAITPRQYDRDHARLRQELWQVDYELERLSARKRVR